MKQTWHECWLEKHTHKFRLLGQSESFERKKNWREPYKELDRYVHLAATTAIIKKLPESRNIIANNNKLSWPPNRLTHTTHTHARHSDRQTDWQIWSKGRHWQSMYLLSNNWTLKLFGFYARFGHLMLGYRLAAWLASSDATAAPVGHHHHHHHHLQRLLLLLFRPAVHLADIFWSSSDKNTINYTLHSCSKLSGNSNRAIESNKHTKMNVFLLSLSFFHLVFYVTCALRYQTVDNLIDLCLFSYFGCSSWKFMTIDFESHMAKIWQNGKERWWKKEMKQETRRMPSHNGVNFMTAINVLL